MLQLITLVTDLFLFPIAFGLASADSSGQLSGIISGGGSTIEVLFAWLNQQVLGAVVRAAVLFGR